MIQAELALRVTVRSTTLLDQGELLSGHAHPSPLESRPTLCNERLKALELSVGVAHSSHR